MNNHAATCVCRVISQVFMDNEPLKIVQMLCYTFIDKPRLASLHPCSTLDKSGAEKGLYYQGYRPFGN
ncbi:hypothetical protein GDO78_020472 [Eleutherodactylus coqui]|uniref:Uncharacterized protein n=1 Tax=Eleutherodactylus coqui TaxID=57060 RepID=A0A8J6BBG0_ELECQ|nr:hypothetical protein GDO78_020472 [Eleutherodactylus coqui]